MTDIPAIFVDTHNALRDSGGGVQVCNREHLETLAAAGFLVQKVPFDLDRRPLTRVTNRLAPKLRPDSTPPGLVQLVRRAITDTRAQFVFYGLTRFATLSRQLHESFPDVKQVLLSLGTECVDFAIEQQMRRRTGNENHSRRRVVQMLGEDIFREFELRRYIDAALALSPFEADLEKWFGTPIVQWIPRTIVQSTLELRPVDGRVGCVSTLDHPPNYDGLVRLCEDLSAAGDQTLRFRLVGRPSEIGRRLAQMFPFVEYVGALDDAELRVEAATWCCFVHPLFVYAKGCSTKLGVGLGWGLPIATTEYGVRGYKWDDSVLPLAKTSADLALSVLERSRANRFQSFQQQTFGIVAQTPTRADLAAGIRRVLLKEQPQKENLAR